MEESGNIIIKALEGSRRELHSMGIEIKQGSGFADNYGIIMKDLAQRVNGSADAFSKTGAGAIAAYNTQVKYLQEELGNELLPALTSTASGASRFIQVLGILPKFISDNRQAIIALAGAYITMNSVLIAETLTTGYNTAAKIANAVAERASTIAKTAGFIATGLYQVAYAVLTGEIGLATAATGLFATATAAASGGLTLIVGAIVALGTGLAIYASRLNDAERAEKSMIETRNSAEQSIQKEKTQLDLLLDTAKNETLSKEKRLEAIQKINEISPEYLNSITLENVGTKEGTEIVNKYVEALQRKATVQAAEEKIVELNKQRVDALNKSQGDLVTTGDILKQTMLDIITIGIHESDYDKIATENKKELVAGIDAQIEAQKKLITLQNGNGDEGKEKVDELKKLQDFYSKAAQYRKDFDALNLNSSAAEINRVKSTYETLNNQLATFQSEGLITLQKYLEVKRELSKNDAVKEEEDAEKRAADAAKKREEERKKKQEQERKELATFMEQLAALRNENGVLELDENAKAIVASREKFEKLYEFAKEHWGEDGKITQELERYYAEEVNRLEDKNTEKKYKESYDNRVKLITNMYAELKAKAQDDKSAVLALDISEYNAKAQLAKDYITVVKSAKTDQAAAEEAAAKARVDLEKETLRQLKEVDKLNDSTNTILAELTKDLEAQTQAKLKNLNEWLATEKTAHKGQIAYLAALDKNYEAQKQKIVEDGEEAIRSKVMGIYQTLSSGINSVINNIVSIENQADEAKITSATNASNARIAILDKELAAGRISQDNYNSQKAASDAQLAKTTAALKKQEFERNKQAQVIAAISTGISSVLNAYNDGLEAGGPSGPAVGAVFAALAGAFVGTQVALLESQPAPQYAKGGIAQGPSHARGGISMVDSSSGRKVGEMEGGEAYMILSRNTTRNNAGIINELLRTSMYGGGETINWARAGAHPKFNLGGIMDTMQTVRFANGGIFQPQATLNPLPDTRLYDMMGKMISMAQNPPRAYIVYDDVATGATRVNNARARATFQTT